MTLEEEYKAMNDWWAFQRRHQANVFEAVFMDQQTIDDIPDIVSSVSLFFDLPEPKIVETCKTMARILVNPDARESEIQINMASLRQNGINNKVSFRLCVVHEQMHQCLYRTHLGMFPNERWVQELAADLMAGIYTNLYDLASGKYKYAVGKQKASRTHPSGKVRAEIVDYGRLRFNSKTDSDKKNVVSRAINIMPPFIFRHYAEMKKDWQKVLYDIKHPIPPKVEKPIDINSLPDTNLIKQTILRNKAKQ